MRYLMILVSAGNHYMTVCLYSSSYHGFSNTNSANTPDDAHLDRKDRGFWCKGQDAYFDVRVFYHNASRYHSLSLASAY